VVETNQLLKLKTKTTQDVSGISQLMMKQNQVQIQEQFIPFIQID